MTTIACLDRDSYTIYDWMTDPDGLDLKPGSADLAVYACLYRRGNQGSATVVMSQSDLAARTRYSRQSVNGAVKRLLERGLIAMEHSYRTLKEAKGFRSIRGYRIVQEPVNEAILNSTPMMYCNPEYSWSPSPEDRGAVDDATYQMGLSNFPQPAGRAVVKQPDTEFSTGSSFQQPAGRAVVKPLDNTGDSEGQDAKKLKKQKHFVKQADNLATCGNVESEPRQTGPSTCGGDNKTAGFDFDQKYIQDEDEDEDEYISSLSSSSSTYNGNRSFGIEPAGWSELSEKDRQTFARFLAASSKSMLVTSKPEKLFDTQAAFVSCIRQGYTADEIFEAFDRYLNWFWGPQNTLGRETRFEMFPQNFLTARKGLYRWAHEDGVLPAFETVGSSTANGGEKSPDGAVGSPEPLNLRRLPDGGWMFQGKNRLWYPVGRDSQGKTRNEALEAAIELMRRDA